MLHKVGQEDNVSYFGNGHGKKDFVLNMVWQSQFDKPIQRHLSSNEEAKRLENVVIEKPKSTVHMDECFDEFKKTELLDEDNMWYCNKCKEHVQATKKLELYKIPPIMVVNLKRFKHQKQSRSYLGMGMGMGSYGQKQDMLVEFPISGLDMSKHLIGQNGEGNLIYDLYAVSNHFGNMGFGHYTAYAKNPFTNKWYEFDDGSVN
mmetsp:Transcript_13296/g.22576  ORF Transcript_13296/g.22576 Transcript_13296/m.22576 type:complete len:204 (-) Transcript_13296:215-826(-)